MEAAVSPNTGACDSVPGSQVGRELAMVAEDESPDVGSQEWGECTARLIFYVLLAQHLKSAESDFILKKIVYISYTREFVVENSPSTR